MTTAAAAASFMRTAGADLSTIVPLPAMKADVPLRMIIPSQLLAIGVAQIVEIPRCKRSGDPRSLSSALMTVRGSWNCEKLQPLCNPQMRPT